MAQININDLKIAGSDLFSDSESYLTDLSNDSEFSNIKGGTSIRLPITWWTVPVYVL